MLVFVMKDLDEFEWFDGDIAKVWCGKVEDWILVRQMTESLVKAGELV